MDRTAAVDGFRLAYERAGAGPAVVLLHGWPGDRSDCRGVVALLPTADVVVPDLRGFGESDKHPADPTMQYSAVAQARSIIALIEGLGLDRPILGGDVRLQQVGGGHFVPLECPPEFAAAAAAAAATTPT